MAPGGRLREAKDDAWICLIHVTETSCFVSTQMYFSLKRCMIRTNVRRTEWKRRDCRPWITFITDNHKLDGLATVVYYLTALETASLKPDVIWVDKSRRES